MANKGSGEQFTIDVMKFAQKAKGNILTFIVVFIQDLTEELIIATPGPGNSIAKNPRPGQPTGFLRGSWIATLGAPGNGEGHDDPTGAVTVSKASMVAAGMELGEAFYIVNTATYAKRLEYGFVGTDSLGRNIDQAPRAFVRSTVNRAPEIASVTAENVAAGRLGGRTGGILNGKLVVGPNEWSAE